MDVLVIDDDATERDAMRELLEINGHTVEVAGNPREAVRKLEATTFDAVVSDVMMPGNGSAVVDYVRAAQPRTPVVLVSAQDSRKARRGAAFYLPKPIRPGDLLAVLARIFALHTLRRVRSRQA